MKLKAILPFVCLLLCSALTACQAAQAHKASGYPQQIELSLETVGADAPVLVGSLEFSGGTLYYDVSAGDGGGLFIGFYPEQELPAGPITWDRYMEGALPFIGDGKSIDVSEGVGDLSGRLYVYVGSSDTDLSDVRGTIGYQPAESPSREAAS